MNNRRKTAENHRKTAENRRNSDSALLYMSHVLKSAKI